MKLTKQFLLSLFIVVACSITASSFFSGKAFAIFNQPAAIAPKDIKIKAANDIYFLGNGDDNCVPSGGSGTYFSNACGNTAKEIYWSVLRQHFDTVQVAGIFGNIDNEGSFSPTKWQYNLVSGPGAPLKRPFDELYNWPACSGSDCAGGVGSFQITSALGPYLRDLGSKAPELLEYFKDTKYSADGDEVLKIMPKDVFMKLVELEVDYVMNVHLDKSKIDEFKSKTDPGDAARWWSSNYEMCTPCLDPNSSENDQRAASAQREYTAMGNFSCSSANNSDPSDSSDDDSDSSSSTDSDNSTSPSNNASSGSVSNSSSSSSANSGITWIGDSYSVGANTKGLISKNFSDVDFGPNSSYIEVGKFVSNSGSGGGKPCLDLLEEAIDSGKLRSKLVFACGTNGGWTSGDIKKFKKLLDGKNVKAIVVNSRIPGNDYASSNKLLADLASSTDYVTLADWASVYKEEYFASDPEKIHPNSDPGYEKWIEAIAGANGSAGASCSSYEGDYPEYIQKTTYTCGPASMAMLATVAASQDVLESDVIDVIGNDRAYANTIGTGMTELDKKVGEKYGFEVIDVPYSSFDEAEEKMAEYLDNGYMLHFSGKGDYPFTPKSGHYIGIFDWADKDKGTVKIADSNKGNADLSLHDVIHAGLHGGTFAAIKKGSSLGCGLPSADVCAEDSSSSSFISSGNAVLDSVKQIIDLANKNGSDYTWGGGHTTDSGVFDAMLNGAPINVDCTGFASLVMYKTYGKMTSFTSYSIFSDPLYEEVPREEVRPGDVFAYNSPSGHGGIVIEVKNGKVTKIAETDDNASGKSGANHNIGYSDSNDFSVQNVNGPNGHFFRFKG